MINSSNPVHPLGSSGPAFVFTDRFLLLPVRPLYCRSGSWSWGAAISQVDKMIDVLLRTIFRKIQIDCPVLIFWIKGTNESFLVCYFFKKVRQTLQEEYKPKEFIFIKCCWNYSNKFKFNPQHKRSSLQLSLSHSSTDYYSMGLKQLSKCATHSHTAAIHMPHSAVSTQALCYCTFRIGWAAGSTKVVQKIFKPVNVQKWNANRHQP